MFQELDLLDADSTVYKLTGPVLIKQDLAEARQNVGKRLEFINSEMFVIFHLWCILPSHDM